MRLLSVGLVPILAFLASASAQELPRADAVRIREFYQLATEVQDKVWPRWNEIPAPLLLVTDKAEFLIHHPAPPKDFNKITEDIYIRPRQFPTNLLATFPAFGPPSVIVIGEPASTSSKTSTAWLITVMHEHFLQLQNAQPGYLQAVEDLGLSHGHKTGMWMLHYPSRTTSRKCRGRSWEFAIYCSMRSTKPTEINSQNWGRNMSLNERAFSHNSLQMTTNISHSNFGRRGSPAIHRLR